MIENAEQKLTALLTLVGTPRRCTGTTCGATVWWVRTKNGKPMPVDADGTPHFATCPNVAEFRR